MQKRRSGDSFRAEWLALAIRACLPTPAPVALTAGLETDGLRFVLTTGDECTVRPGEASDPDVVVRADPLGLLALFAGRTPLSQVRVSGDRRKLEQLLAR